MARIVDSPDNRPIWTPVAGVTFAMWRAYARNPDGDQIRLDAWREDDGGGGWDVRPPAEPSWPVGDIAETMGTAAGNVTIC